MSESFLGEVRLMSFNFAPKGWAHCNGQLLPINQNQALFSLFGNTYGGNGQTTFALPDLRGRTPVHRGASIVQGQMAGNEVTTLTISQLPQHTHFAQGTDAAASSGSPQSNVLAKGAQSHFGNASSDSVMASTSISIAGGSQPHENRQPSLAINFCVALQGFFPSLN